MTDKLRISRELPPMRLFTTSERRSIETDGATGATVSAVMLTGGTWANRSLLVKRRTGPRSDAFAAAKTIAPGGGSVQISADEMAGVAELEIVTSGSADSGVEVLVTVVLEKDEPPAAPAASFVQARLGDKETAPIDQFPVES